MANKKEVVGYTSMDDDGEEGIPYCCRTWRSMPHSVRWTLIGCSVIVMAALVASLYVWARHGSGGIHSSSVVTMIMGPLVCALAISAIILLILCHERRRNKDRVKVHGTQRRLANNGLSMYSPNSEMVAAHM